MHSPTGRVTLAGHEASARPHRRGRSRAPSSRSVAAAPDARARAASSRPDGARALVEAALGRRAERRQLSLDFAPATATRWELLIDGAVVLPAHARGHRGRDVGRPHPDLRVQGGRDRRPSSATCSSRKVAAGVGVRIITEAGVQPARPRLEGVLRHAGRRRRPGRRQPGRRSSTSTGCSASDASTGASTTSAISTTARSWSSTAGSATSAAPASRTTTRPGRTT